MHIDSHFQIWCYVLIGGSQGAGLIASGVRAACVQSQTVTLNDEVAQILRAVDISGCDTILNNK